MLASLTKRRLLCVHQVAQALRLSADQPVDEQLLRLIELAQRDPSIAALVSIVRERPGYLLTSACKEDKRLLAALRSIGLDWSKFAAGLLPRLVAAADVIHEFSLECRGEPRTDSPDRSVDVGADAAPGYRLRPGADRRDPD